MYLSFLFFRRRRTSIDPREREARLISIGKGKEQLDTGKIVLWNELEVGKKSGVLLFRY